MNRRDMEFARNITYLSGVSETVPRLFDTALARRRLARARDGPSAFLAETISEEACHRMAQVLRDFETTLIYGIGGPQAARRLGPSRRHRTIITAGSLARSGGQLIFDAEALPFAPESLGCIISLLALQSVNDLPGALIQIRRALKPDGLLLACLFGGATLNELRSSWIEVESQAYGGVTPRVAPFADVREMGMLLQRAGFALPVADSDRTVVRYANAMALMREVKAIGMSNTLAGRSRRPVTPALLARAAAAYEQGFSDPDGRVRATVETIWLTAWAPHESQPQPLKPGSARTRLADALRTSETRLPR